MPPKHATTAVEKNHNNLFDLPAQWCQLWDGVQIQHNFSQRWRRQRATTSRLAGSHSFLSPATHLIWQTWAVLSRAQCRETDAMSGERAIERWQDGASNICDYGRVNDDTLHVCRVTRPCTKYWWGSSPPNRPFPTIFQLRKLPGTCKVCNTFLIQLRPQNVVDDVEVMMMMMMMMAMMGEEWKRKSWICLSKEGVFLPWSRV